MSTKVVNLYKEEYFWPYFAACIDCDGWITKSTHNNLDGNVSSIYRYVVGFTQHIKNEDGVKWISEQLRLEGISHTYCYRDSHTDKPIKMINLTIKQRESLVKILKNIIPYLKFKKEKASRALIYTEERILKAPLSKFTEINKTNKTNIYWTNQEVEILNIMVEGGYNNIAIGCKLNRSVDSIAKKKSRLKNK